ncbi:hypothetical protein J4Q44_G00169930 [Coregonus suidteri]|uniref:SFR19-like C-terminal domain-containing protein n=1 Tax=Coregonus suidteri TaxID=861788 RepID=A0AAN8QP11_9TELE
MGDVVSSTSASLAPPSSHSDPPFSSSDPLLCLSSSPQRGTDGQKECETEIYDPFHPTEGEREGGAAEEVEGEKYDPFDPTGSPPSAREEEERETGGGRERGNSVSSKGKRRKAETGRTGGEEKDNAPPDSTDALSVPPLSPRSLPLPLRRRLDRTKEPRVKVRDRREKADHSDHSEIEEGEIVGATERDGGKREERGREGVLPLVLPISSGSPFLHGGAKPERILRVLEGDSFVSVRAEGDWAGPVMPGREDGEPMEEEEEEEEEEVVVVGVGDLRRKLVSRRNARYRSSCRSSLSPQHLPPSPHTLPLPSSPPSPLTAEKDKSRKSSKSSKERERRKRKEGKDLNGSDLFAIKRTITVTTTTTTTLPGSPPLAPSSPRSPSQGSDKPHKRKKKRRRRSDEGLEDSMGRRGSRSLSPPSHYHGYDSDHFSDKLEIDIHSLDGEALDSDYPSIEDSPPPPQPLEPAAPSPSAKPKTATKSGRHHFKKKSRTGKKAGQSESSSSSSVRPKGKGLSTSSLSPTQATSGPASAPATLPSLGKRGRKMGKEKERGEKGGKKESGRSGRSKKLSGGGGRKAKLQSKVSVLVREGVSSTTGGPVGSGKLGMELLGAGGPVGGSGGPVVGGSIAVVFRRDNESRSPFLKPCSEPLLLSGRNKDLGKVGKRSSLAAPPSSSLANPTVAALKSKKAKPSSTTSTSSSASSPSLALATKRRRRLAKKTRAEKGLAGGLTDVDGALANCSSEGGGWGGTSSDIQSGVGAKPSSPRSGPAGPIPSSSSSSSSSSSTSVLPPSSSPPHTSPPSLPASRDARESSPDSQTVDSSCKTPEPSFLPEDCPAQTQSTPNLPPSSPPALPSSQGAGLSQYGPSNMKPLPLDEGPKSLASPPCSSSSGSAPASLSLPPSSTDPSSSSSSSVSSSSANKLPPPPPPPPPAAPTLPWSLQTGVDCTAGGVLALTALLFKMEEANIASRAKAQEFIHATSQILSQTNQNHSSQHAPSSSSSSQVLPPPGPTPAQFILHSSLPLVGCTKSLPSHLHPGMSMGGGCAQTPPPPMPSGFLGGSGGSSDIGWDNESKDPDKYLKKLHTQERAVEEVKLAIKPYYQRKDINKDDYKDILRKAVHKICHSRTGEINPVKVSNLVKLYVQRYKYFRKHGRKMDEEEREDREMDSSY